MIHTRTHTTSFLYNTLIIFSACILWVAGAFIAPTFVHAEEKGTPTITETKKQVDELFELKDDTTISQTEKENQEIALRISILQNVITLAQKDIINTQSLVEKLSFDDQTSWNTIKKDIITRLQDAHTYYESIAKKLTTSTPLTTQDLKIIAKNLEEEKLTTIDPLIKEAHIVTTLFHIPSILDIVDDRLAKVNIDVEKIYNQKIAKNNSLQAHLTNATKFVTQAHTDYIAAKDLYELIYTPKTASSTERALTTYTSLLKNKTITTSTTTTTQPLTKTELAEFHAYTALEAHARNTFESAIKNIKGAYDIFIKMSKQVKDYLQ